MVRTKNAEKKINVEFEEELPQEQSSSEPEPENSAEHPKSEKKKKHSRTSGEKSEKLREEVQKMQEQLLWLKAEFANYKKRVEKEKYELSDYIRAEVIRKLLPVLDDFKIMLEKAQAGENEGAVLEGAKMIHDKLVQFLETEGVEKIESLGQKFNPEIHEALLSQATDSEEDHDKILQVYQDGYRLRERMIRPSKVIVGKFDKDKKN